MIASSAGRQSLRHRARPHHPLPISPSARLLVLLLADGAALPLAWHVASLIHTDSRIPFAHDPWLARGVACVAWLAGNIWLSRRLGRALAPVLSRHRHAVLLAALQRLGRQPSVRACCRFAIHAASHLLQSVNCAILLADGSHGGFALAAVRYPSLLPSDLRIEAAHPLISLLRARPDAMQIETLEVSVATGGLLEASGSLGEISRWLRMLELRMAVPIPGPDGLAGLLLFGAGRRPGPYPAEDALIGELLARQLGAALIQAELREHLAGEASLLQTTSRFADLGCLAAGLAHDVQNPLTIISGEVQLYQSRASGKDALVDDLAASILEECQRASAISRQVLRFAKAPVGIGPIDLAVVVRESLDLASYLIGAERVERDVDLLTTPLPPVQGSRRELQDACLHLILRALRSGIEHGGHLVVRADVSGEWVELEIGLAGAAESGPRSGSPEAAADVGLLAAGAIARSHGGWLEWRCDGGASAIGCLRLPAGAATEGRVTVADGA